MMRTGLYCLLINTLPMDIGDWDLIAKSYHDVIISPFFGKISNPIYGELMKVRGRREKTLAEFGCGFLYLGEFLSKNFKRVHASDFSQEMVKVAKSRNAGLKNVTIRREDIRTIKYRNAFDVVVIVNSILMPSFKDIIRSFSNIHASLKRDGQLIMILPSMESVLYYGMLLLDSELDIKSEAAAIKSAKRRFEGHKYDFFLGQYRDGRQVQKFYYMHELMHLLGKAGFDDIAFKRVEYPWDVGISDYESFPNEERLWDWFVTARKRHA